MTIQEKLEKLAELHNFITMYETTKNDTKQLLDGEIQTLINSVLTPEILAKVADIKAEFQPKYDLLENDSTFVANKAAADALTAEIKDEVVALGETVKGSCLMAVYAKGRVSWDDKALEGYAAAHPEIQPFRKVGNPSESIRKA